MNNSNKPIRVLHLFSIMNRGGAETMCMNLYRNINRKIIQFDFLVYHQEKGQYDDEIESLGGKIYRIPFLKPMTLLNHIKGIRLFFREHPDYKIVHNHMGGNGAFIIREAQKKGIEVRIYHSHFEKTPFIAPTIRLTIRRQIYKYFEWYTRLLSNSYFSCGPRAAEVFKKGSFVHILNNAIDIDKYSYNREIRSKIRKTYKCEKNIIIGQTARFDNNKNQTFSIDILNELIKINPQYRLWLIGDGINKLQIEKKVKDLQLQNYVNFFGVRSDVNELLQAIDIFLFPSIKEGLPVSCIEAQAAGLPCVFSDSFDPATVITDNCTVLSLNDESDKWAKAIIEKSIIKRKDMTSIIRKAGYDINETSKYIENFYLSKVS